MIEQVKNWIVETSLVIREIECFCESETRKMLFYRYLNADEDDEGVYTPEYPDRFFNSEDDARDYVADRMAYLKNMSESVFKIIEEIKLIDDKVCSFDRKDFLRKLEDYRYTHYESSWKKASASCCILKQFIQTGTLTVNAVTFSKDEVKRVKWYNDDHALLILKDDESVMTRTAAEFDIVCTLFGENISGMEYTASFDEKGKVVNNKK